jgi:serine/threonine protein phosphatase PrpC
MLVELANRNGGRDNITVLLIYLDEVTLKNRISNLFGRRT